MQSRQLPFLLTLVFLTLILGSLMLSIIDESTRPAFFELVKLVTTGILGWLIPSPKIN